MQNHCRGLSPSEGKSEILTFCWGLEKDKAAQVQYLNFQNKKFWGTLFQCQKDVISFSFFLFFKVLWVWVFFTPLCVQTSDWPWLSTFWNFLIIKILFYLLCRKCCYWCTVISLFCSIFSAASFAFIWSYHFLLLLFLSCHSFAFMLPLFPQFHTPELVYAFISLCLRCLFNSSL